MPSDRSCSPLPARNRQDHQGQRRSLPCFPRWCGPMGSAVQNLPNMSRPQMIPKWPPCQPGPSGMGRMMTPQLPQSWTMSQPFPPVPPSMPPPSTIASSPMLGRLPTQACPPTQACSPTQPCFSPSQPSPRAPLQPDPHPLRPYHRCITRLWF